MKTQKSFFTKAFFLALALVFTFGLSACGKKTNRPADANVNLNINGAPETGKMIDITDLNNQTVTTTPGDILYLKFAGVLENGYQWDFTAPTSGDYLMLKDHQFNKTPDAQNQKIENYTNEWRIKIEKTGIFDLQFNYNDYRRLNKKGLSALKPDKIFKLKIISE
ncbi:MAG: hypothetical protein A3J65_01385 [Candidatus Buchananbacteria bacterium RIFCSPHIGHO2_02_FULL_45_11b]|uniref:Proteinase inhibitor I42 chagasin domain-containing protein n=4 Tax=Candidatus Buchananiibacteriota TaxID=1817903 RepID=A0A1G1YFE9_9BACT|nr:MAG: hypothetical protein A2663_01825 [Candidatus Buchananbacteria bacterium RIFCSPHIGHO2_01_FULL_46_12]OGY51009.1 MAG: hypothetical protein A3J65_01385 [Candidatus Buchananbacteria bacterium RIFCSPHIGHO2_02_FULL_45_11b]OGY52922.1 MAG: hypothetical protein A3B15_02250 [Candidatus Buchananbacteria bacterium RIFCSPLOWO2_01_FULL_45_31]OGY56860.1 MAG: hypothetical protein A3H67_01945 [Candidatus Buchananbacteria bacterium RIFCSPLOWO2_02_FULL_46_11b]